MAIKWVTPLVKTSATRWMDQAKDSGKEKTRISYPNVDLFVKIGRRTRQAWNKSFRTSKNPERIPSSKEGRIIVMPIMSTLEWGMKIYEITSGWQIKKTVYNIQILSPMIHFTIGLNFSKSKTQDITLRGNLSH
jgi:hypothetical protein